MRRWLSSTLTYYPESSGLNSHGLALARVGA
jgi:hypothetical protein